MMRRSIVTAIAVVFIGSSFVSLPAAEEPLTGERLRQDLGLIRNNMRAIAELIDRLDGGPGDADLFQPPLELPEGPVGAESYRVWLGAVKADLFRNYWCLNGLVNAPEPGTAAGMPVRSVRWVTDGRGGSHELSLPADGEVNNLEVAIHNRGRTIVVNPRVVANGKRDWHSTSSILAEILQDNMSDKEKALAIWEFLRDNRYHYEPPASAHENHDPVKFIGVYGYGFCDDSSSNFTALAQAAGLKGRIWGLAGHVVPEVWYDDAWHMLDPDGKAYYCYPDKETIASIADIVAHPEILSQPKDQYYGVDMLTRIYTTTENNSLHDWYLSTLSTEHTLDISLRPGESLVRSWGNRGLYYCGYRYDEPPVYGNGKIVFEPVLEGDRFSVGASEATNLKAVDGGIAPAKAGETSALTYRFDSPYLLLDGEVGLEYRAEKPGIKVGLEVETDDGWILRGAFETTGTGDGEVVLPLDGCFVNGHGLPTYSISLKLTIDGSGGGVPIVLKRIIYDLDFQCSPMALPALEPGDNRIEFRSESSDGGGIEIEHRFSLDLEG
ncbi:transglutaminase family protein [candidate division KSB1 bacterium]